MSDTRWLTPREREAWLALTAVILTLPARLDAQLQRDARVTFFDYLVLAMLSEAPGRTLRMSELAARSNASLSRLSHVASKLETRGWVRRLPCPEDARTTLAELTDTGLEAIESAAPAHVETVRKLVFDALRPEQVDELARIGGAILTRVDPQGRLTVTPRARQATREPEDATPDGHRARGPHP